jgi:hypothetical protein
MAYNNRIVVLELAPARCGQLQPGKRVQLPADPDSADNGAMLSAGHTTSFIGTAENGNL